MFSASLNAAFGGLGAITDAQAQGYARGISSIALMEPAPPDKKLVEQILSAVMSLGLPSIADEQLVIMALRNFGVKGLVVDAALMSIPPYASTTPESPTAPVVLTPQQRVAMVPALVRQNMGMSTFTKVALGVSVVALVGALVMITKERRGAAI